MSWVQCKTPNTNDKTLIVYGTNGKPLTDWYGWCLAVTQQAFGITKRKYASALECWNTSKTKHTEGAYSIPIGMYVPVFFKDNKYGHVVIAYRESGSKVKVWSSPYTHKPYFDYFEGDPVDCLNAVGKKYGCAYCGWIEILTDTRILEWIADPLEQKPVQKPVKNSTKTESEPVEKDTNLKNVITKLIDFLKSLL